MTSSTKHALQRVQKANRSRIQSHSDSSRLVTRLLVLAATMALLLASTLATPAAADYSSDPASAITCTQIEGRTTCTIDAPIDAGSIVSMTVGSTIGASFIASGGPQTFAQSGTTGTTATVTFIVSGVGYSAVVIITNVIVPTATPVVTPQPTTIPGTVTPIDYGFGNGIPTKPGPLAISGSNSRYLVAAGLSMVVAGLLLMQRRDTDEIFANED